MPATRERPRRLFEPKIAIKDRPHDAATLRQVANFFLDQNRPNQAAPLVAQLLKPETRASAADVAWANRSMMMLQASPAMVSRPEKAEQALKLRRTGPSSPTPTIST